MKTFSKFLLIFLIQLLGLASFSQSQFYINGKDFIKPSKIIDKEGNIYITLFNYQDTISINGILLDGTPKQQPWGIEYSPDLAVVKLNSNLEVQWIDVISGNNSMLVNISGRLQFDGNENLVLELFASSDIHFSSGEVSKNLAPSQAHQTILVNYDKNTGNIQNIRAFKYLEYATPLYAFKLLENGDWLIDGFLFRNPTLQIFDTTISVPYYGSPVNTSFIARYSPVENRIKWVSFLEAKMNVFVGKHFFDSKIIEGDVLTGSVSSKDSLVINGNLRGVASSPYGGMNQFCRMDLKTGKVEVIKEINGVPTVGSYGEFIQTDFGYLLATVPFDDFIFDQVNFPGHLPDFSLNSYLLKLDKDLNLIDYLSYEPILNPLEVPNLCLIQNKIAHVSRVETSETIKVGNKSLDLTSNKESTVVVAYLDQNLNVENLEWPFDKGEVRNYDGFEIKNKFFDEYWFGDASSTNFLNVDTNRGNNLWLIRKNPSFKYFTPDHKRFKIYPNVFDGNQEEIYIVLNANTDCEVFFYDQTGRILEQKRYSSTSLTLSIKIPQSKMSAASYFLKIIPTQGEEQVFKLIKTE